MADRNRQKAPSVTDAHDAEPVAVPAMSDDIAEIVLVEPVREVPEPADPVAMPTEKARPAPRVFLSAVAGGGLAALVGFGLSHFNILGLSTAPADVLAVADRLAAVESAQVAAETGLTDMRNAVDTAQQIDPALADRVAALERAMAEPPEASDLSSVTDRLDRLDAQMTALTAMPADGSGASAVALAALQEEVRRLKSAAPGVSADLQALVSQTEARLAGAETRAQALAQTAAATTLMAALSTALGQMRAAFDTGQPYTAALTALDGLNVPAAISDRATVGLPTLARLSADFPPAARAALEAALRANMGESWSDRIGTFLRTQTGARSLTPREGSDPDAILSRAEASLAAGNLDAAIDEIATLPPEAQTAMQDWTELAKQRSAAVAALVKLAARIEG